VFIWDSCMYVVGFAPLIIFAIVFLHWCIVLCVHLELVYVRCWFCTGALFFAYIWDLCMYVVGSSRLIILEIVFLPRCVVICVYLGLMYIRCWFCP
jgi:hypothetical protein